MEYIYIHTHIYIYTHIHVCIDREIYIYRKWKYSCRDRCEPVDTLLRENKQNWNSDDNEKECEDVLECASCSRVIDVHCGIAWNHLNQSPQTRRTEKRGLRRRRRRWWWWWWGSRGEFQSRGSRWWGGRGGRGLGREQSGQRSASNHTKQSHANHQKYLRQRQKIILMGGGWCRVNVCMCQYRPRGWVKVLRCKNWLF